MDLLSRRAIFIFSLTLSLCCAACTEETGDPQTVPDASPDTSGTSDTSGASGTTSDTSGTSTSADTSGTTSDTSGTSGTSTSADTSGTSGTTSDTSGTSTSSDTSGTSGTTSDTSGATEDAEDADTTEDPFAGLPNGTLRARISANKEIARVPAADAPLSDSQSALSANAEATVTAFAWTFSDAETQQVVMTSSDASPTFTCPDSARAAYDVSLKVTDGQVVSAFHERRLITCTLPRTPAGRPVIDVDLTQSSYLQQGMANGAVVQPGSLLRVRGSISQNFVFFNFQGTAEAPIHIINDGLVQNTDASWLLHLTNCRHVIIDGFGDDSVPYGFVLDNATDNGSQAFWIRFYTQGANVAAAPTDIEVFGVHVRRAPGTGLQVTTDGGDTFNRDTWQMDDLHIHHNLIEDVGLEGFYIGYYTDGVTPPPFKMYSSRIYRNIIRRTGWDCLQVSNSVNLELHHNDARDCGTLDVSNQRSTFQYNPGNVDAAIYNNRFIDTIGGSVDMQVGCTGGDALIYSNVFQSPGGVYIHGGAADATRWWLFHNTFSFTDTGAVRVNRTAAPASCQGAGSFASANATHNLALTPDSPVLSVIAGSNDTTGWVLGPNLLAPPSDRASLCLSPSSDADPLHPTCATSSALTPDGDALSTLGLTLADLPGGVLTDITGRVLSGPHGHGAYATTP
jgi:hypothetical protein